MAAGRGGNVINDNKPKNTTAQNSTTTDINYSSFLITHVSHGTVREVCHMLLLSPQLLDQHGHHLRLLVHEVNPNGPNNVVHWRPLRRLSRTLEYRAANNATAEAASTQSNAVARPWRKLWWWRRRAAAASALLTALGGAG